MTALAQDASARKRLGAIDPHQALAIGPAGAPQVIEFTDPDRPYCQALERFWVARAAEAKPVRRLIYFVSGNHPEAAARAEHILKAGPAGTIAAMPSGGQRSRPCDRRRQAPAWSSQGGAVHAPPV